MGIGMEFKIKFTVHLQAPGRSTKKMCCSCQNVISHGIKMWLKENHLKHSSFTIRILWVTINLYLCRGKLLRPACAPPLADQRTAGILLLGESLRHHPLVRRGVLLVAEDAGELGRFPRTLALEDQRRHEALDFGRAADLLPLLVGEGAGDDVLGDVVLLRQVEQGADLVGALRPEAAGDGDVREAGELVVADLDDGEVEDGDVLPDDAPADALALALARAPRPVALVPLVHQQADAGVGEDALTHRKALLVVAARDAQDVAGELLAQHRAIDFLRHAALVKVLEPFFIVDLNDLLKACAGTGYVDLRSDKIESTWSEHGCWAAVVPFVETN